MKDYDKQSKDGKDKQHKVEGKTRKKITFRDVEKTVPFLTDEGITVWLKILKKTQIY